MSVVVLWQTELAHADVQRLADGAVVSALQLTRLQSEVPWI